MSLAVSSSSMSRLWDSNRSGTERYCNFENVFLGKLLHSADAVWNDKGHYAGEKVQQYGRRTIR